MTEPAGGAADRPWLVVIDMQNVFASPESPWRTPGFDTILDNNRAADRGLRGARRLHPVHRA